MRHVDTSDALAGDFDVPDASRDAASFAPTSSSEDEGSSEPGCKLQFNSGDGGASRSCGVAKSPGEPGEVKRAKYDDDALDFSTSKNVLVSILHFLEIV